MINIILTGKGGKMICKIEELINIHYQNKINILAILGRSDNFEDYDDLFKIADMIVDFSNIDNLGRLLSISKQYQIKLLIGTTGFLEADFEKMKESSKYTSILYSYNSSRLIFIMNKLAKIAADLIGDAYDIEMIDIHHKYKKDSPSGTAKMIVNNLGKDNVKFSSIRAGGVSGTHNLMFVGENDMLEIKVTSFNRDIFAFGAIDSIIAFDKITEKGFYNMDDLFK